MLLSSSPCAASFSVCRRVRSLLCLFCEQTSFAGVGWESFVLGNEELPDSTGAAESAKYVECFGCWRTARMLSRTVMDGYSWGLQAGPTHLNCQCQEQQQGKPATRQRKGLMLSYFFPPRQKGCWILEFSHVLISSKESVGPGRLHRWNRPGLFLLPDLGWVPGEPWTLGCSALTCWAY